MQSITEDTQVLNEAQVREDIRLAVWGEYYEVFGYMLSESMYGSLIAEEVERRYNLHREKEQEVLNKMLNVSQNNTIDSTLAVCDENSIPQQMEQEINPECFNGNFDYDAFWDWKMGKVVDDTQKEGIKQYEEEKSENDWDVDRSVIDDLPI